MKKTSLILAAICLFAHTVRADVIEWKGGGDSASWRDGTNWKGDVAPVAEDVAVIPDNVEAVASCKDDVDFMNTLSKVKLLGDGSVLCVSNLETSVTMTVPLEGRGTFMHRNQKNNAASVGAGSDLHYYPLTLKADNSNFTGTFVSTNAGLRVSHENALGGVNGGVVRVYLSSVQRFGISGNLSFYNELYIKGGYYSSNYFFSANNASWYGDIHVLGGIMFHANTAQMTFRIYGDVTVEGNYEIQWNKGGTVVYYGKVKGPTGTASTYGSPHVGGESHSKNFSRLFFGGTMKCFATNVFAVGYNEIRYGQSSDGVLDLNGFDQELSGVRLVTGSNGAIFKSEKPAVLSMIDNEGASTPNTYYYFDGRGKDAFQGKLTFVHVPTNAANNLKKKLALKNMTCTTSGGIESAYGTLTIDANALFPNLTKLGIRGTGSMVVNSDNGLGNASGALAVSLQGTGKLTIAENTVIRAKTANAGVRSDGALNWLEAGEYTKANLPDYIDGDGMLIVAEYGGPKGLMLIFR